MDFVVVGSINMDATYFVKRFPKKGETISVKHFKITPGGKGANQSAAIALLGGKTLLIGAVGEDDYGKRLEASLANNGVETKGIAKVKEPTGNAFITVNDNGDNLLLYYFGANAQVKYEWVEKFSEEIKKATYLVIQLELPLDTVIQTIHLAHELGTKVILDPAPAQKLPNEIYSKTHIITPNESELSTLTGRQINTNDKIIQAAMELLERGVDKVIVTLGEKGALYLDSKQHYFVESFKVKAVDSTAAGDSFNGGLAVALAEGKTMKSALRFASAVSGLAVTKPGAQESLPTRKQVEDFLTQ